MAQVIAGVVLSEFTQVMPDSAIRQYCPQAEHLITHVAITKHVDSACIGSEIAANLTTSFGAKTQREESIGIQRRLLNI